MTDERRARRRGRCVVTDLLDDLTALLDRHAPTLTTTED